MDGLKEKLLNKVNTKEPGKKKIENLVVFVIILIVTIIFINYIWNDNLKKIKKQDNVNNITNLSGELANSSSIETSSSEDRLKKQLEEILSKLDGVEEVSVLITYAESNKVVPMYNIDNQESVTQEEDNQGGVRTINETSTKKEVVYEETNGEKNIVKSSIVTPEIKGAVVIAKGANNSVVKANIIQAVEVATRTSNT